MILNKSVKVFSERKGVRRLKFLICTYELSSLKPHNTKEILSTTRLHIQLSYQFILSNFVCKSIFVLTQCSVIGDDHMIKFINFNSIIKLDENIKKIHIHHMSYKLVFIIILIYSLNLIEEIFKLYHLCSVMFAFVSAQIFMCSVCIFIIIVLYFCVVNKSI